MGIQALAPQPGTSKRAPGRKIYPYLLRKLAITRPNQVWALRVSLCSSAVATARRCRAPSICALSGRGPRLLLYLRSAVVTITSALAAAAARHSARRSSVHFRHSCPGGRGAPKVEAVDMGREQRNPGAMVTALSTIAKVLEYTYPQLLIQKPVTRLGVILDRQVGQYSSGADTQLTSPLFSPLFAAP